MSESDRLYLRISRSLKSNTQELVDRLYMLELRENQNLTAYVIEAIKEKRERDESLLEAPRYQAVNENVRTS